MLGAQHLFTCCQSTLEQRSRGCEISIGQIQAREVVQAGSDVGMVCAQDLLANEQSPFKQWPRGCEITQCGLAKIGKTVAQERAAKARRIRRVSHFGKQRERNCVEPARAWPLGRSVVDTL